MADLHPACIDCKYFESVASQQSEDDLQKEITEDEQGRKYLEGYCRRNPPVIFDKTDTFGKWPMVQSWDWCGEWIAVVREPVG